MAVTNNNNRPLLERKKKNHQAGRFSRIIARLLFQHVVAYESPFSLATRSSYDCLFLIPEDASDNNILIQASKQCILLKGL